MSPTEAIIAAKLAAPRTGAALLRRERVRRLLDADARPLTVLSAPAGYGKTAALREWLTTRDRPAAWLTLDAQDNDPRRLGAHLLAALGASAPAAASALAVDADPLTTAIPLLATALDVPGAALVLDDVHVLTDPAAEALLAALLDALPATRVLLAGRTLPRLRLDRRRAAGAIAELDADALRFDAGETAELLNGAFALDLSAEQLAAIEQRAEGWPAGLALIGTAIAAADPHPDEVNRITAGADAVVAGYLTEEVLDGLDAPLREFLRRCSLLRELSAPLCATAFDDPEATRQFDRLRRSQLFVSALDADRLRLHGLFADVLRRELQLHAPRTVPALHRRAAAWLERAGRLTDAIEHACAGGDGELAARLLHDAYPALLDARRSATVERLLDALPPERGEWYAFCEALDVLCSALRGQDSAVVLDRLAALGAWQDRPEVIPVLERIRVNPFHGDAGAAAEAGRAAFARTSDPRQRLRLSGQIAAAFWFVGDRAGVRQVVEPRLRELAAIPDAHAWALAALAMTARDEGEVDAAEHYARRALATVEAAGSPLVGRGFVHAALGAALTARGLLDEAGEALDEALRLVRGGNVGHALALVLACELQLARRDRRRALHTATAARRVLDRHSDPGVLADRLSRVEETLARRGGQVLLGSMPTPAELRVLTLLPTELTYGQIAARLFLSTETVHSHLRRLYRRLDAHSRQEAVDAARERGLLEDAA